MAGVKDFVGVRQILLGLYNEGENFLRSSACNVEAVRSLQPKYPRFKNREHLEATLNMGLGEEGDFGRNYIYVEPPERHRKVVVLLQSAWKIMENREELRLRLGLFVPTGDENRPLGFIGYRFETPEGPGNHNYHHAQPISAFQPGLDPLPEAVSWHPTSYPTIPLKGSGVVQLTACTVISVHGRLGIAKLKKILRSGPAVSNIDEMGISG